MHTRTTSNDHMSDSDTLHRKLDNESDTMLHVQAKKQAWLRDKILTHVANNTSESVILMLFALSMGAMLATSARSSKTVGGTVSHRALALRTSMIPGRCDAAGAAPSPFQAR